MFKFIIMVFALMSITSFSSFAQPVSTGGIARPPGYYNTLDIRSRSAYENLDLIQGQLMSLINNLKPICKIEYKFKEIDDLYLYLLSVQNLAEFDQSKSDRSKKNKKEKNQVKCPVPFQAPKKSNCLVTVDTVKLIKQMMADPYINSYLNFNYSNKVKDVFLIQKFFSELEP